MKNTKLGMEVAGLNPLNFFSPEQIEKMRAMTDGTFRYQKATANIVTLNVHNDIREKLRDARGMSKLPFKSAINFADLIIQLGIKTYEIL
jgi:hypothetical protein